MKYKIENLNKDIIEVSDYYRVHNPICFGGTIDREEVIIDLIKESQAFNDKVTKAVEELYYETHNEDGSILKGKEAVYPLSKSLVKIIHTHNKLLDIKVEDN